MQIAHIALWTTRLEQMRSFYVTYFGGESSEKYVNPGKGFESYFIRFGHSAALEIMSRTDITSPATKRMYRFCHVASKRGNSGSGITTPNPAVGKTVFVSSASHARQATAFSKA